MLRGDDLAIVREVPAHEAAHECPVFAAEAARGLIEGEHGLGCALEQPPGGGEEGRGDECPLGVAIEVHDRRLHRGEAATVRGDQAKHPAIALHERPVEAVACLFVHGEGRSGDGASELLGDQTHGEGAAALGVRLHPREVGGRQGGQRPPGGASLDGQALALVREGDRAGRADAEHGAEGSTLHGDEARCFDVGLHHGLELEGEVAANGAEANPGGREQHGAFPGEGGHAADGVGGNLGVNGEAHLRGPSQGGRWRRRWRRPGRSSGRSLGRPCGWRP